MFGSEKKTVSKPTESVETLIGAQTTFRGDLTFAGGLHISGTVIGSIVAESGNDAVVVLTEQGKIEGEVRAPHVVIAGTLKGDIIASERIELAAQARVTGNIYYKLLQMAAGAQVNGQIVREEEPRKAQGPKAVESEPPAKVKAVS